MPHNLTTTFIFSLLKMINTTTSGDSRKNILGGPRLKVARTFSYTQKVQWIAGKIKKHKPVLFLYPSPEFICFTRLKRWVRWQKDMSIEEGTVSVSNYLLHCLYSTKSKQHNIHRLMNETTDIITFSSCMCLLCLVFVP